MYVPFSQQPPSRFRHLHSLVQLLLFSLSMKLFSRSRGFIPRRVQCWLPQAWKPTDRYIIGCSVTLIFSRCYCC